ncbi:hypothetical protein SIPHO067v1_p0090 [Vibrio phage 51E28.1]|nr:hypothetical protein SIPHO067v1_p0090 [Vibrio phage 51E28.1]
MGFFDKRFRKWYPSQHFEGYCTEVCQKDPMGGNFRTITDANFGSMSEVVIDTEYEQSLG